MTYCCFQKQILEFPLSIFKLHVRNIQRLHYHAFLCVLQTLFRNIATNSAAEMGVLLSATNRQFRGNMKWQKCSLVFADVRASGLWQLVLSILTVRAAIIFLQHWAIINLHRNSGKQTHLSFL